MTSPRATIDSAALNRLAEEVLLLWATKQGLIAADDDAAAKLRSTWSFLERSLELGCGIPEGLGEVVVKLAIS